MRLIDAQTMNRQVREYMKDYRNAPTRLTVCRAILSMLGDKNQVPTIDPVYAAGGCYCRECQFSTCDSKRGKRWCNQGHGEEVRPDGKGFCDLGKRRVTEGSKSEFEMSV